jgi:hypothetical protein
VLRYTNERDIPTYDIAASLIATDEIRKLLPPVLEALFPGLSVESLELNLHTSAAGGSRDDDYRGRLICQFQEDLEAGITRIAEKTGIEALANNKRLLSYLIMAMVLFGSIWAYNQVFGDSSGTHIEGDYNIIVSGVAADAGVSPEQVRRVIEGAFNEREKKRLGRNAIDVVAPAKREEGATITAAPDHSIKLDQNTIREIPASGDFTDDDEPSEVIHNLSIDIRRSDRDERNVGWAGWVKIREFEGRLKMVLVPGINPERLRNLSYEGPITADVEVFYRRRGDSGALKPYVMHVYRVQGIDGGDRDLTQRSQKKEEN